MDFFSKRFFRDLKMSVLEDWIFFSIGRHDLCQNKVFFLLLTKLNSDLVFKTSQKYTNIFK